MQAEKKDLGKNYHPYEGAYLSQVNSIQRHVARDLGIPLVDYEAILQLVCSDSTASQPLANAMDPWPQTISVHRTISAHVAATIRLSRNYSAPL